MRKARRDPVELASDIGAKAFDLLQHGNIEALKALDVVCRVNPDVFAWLRDRLLDLTAQPAIEWPRETRPAQASRPIEGTRETTDDKG